MNFLKCRECHRRLSGPDVDQAVATGRDRDFICQQCRPRFGLIWDAHLVLKRDLHGDRMYDHFWTEIMAGLGINPVMSVRP